MSSDEYFDDAELDPLALEELDAIEAALLAPQDHTSIRVQPSDPAPLAKEDSFYDLTLDIDENDLQMLDDFIEDTYQGKTMSVSDQSDPSSSTSKGMLQTTLFGDVIPNQASYNKPKSQTQGTKSLTRNSLGQKAPKTKKWDRTAFAKTGLKRSKSKGKDKTTRFEGEDVEEGQVEFEQFPAPFVSIGPPPPMKLSPDLLEAKHWIFPLNQPKRDYQFNIVKHCLFDNTLVALPTGLGKTFIAGVVMLNFYRWFPDGKVVFVAPTKPLVSQQIDACHRTCGIPGSDAIELTGQNPRLMRARAWKEKRVFYMTPQTLVNDLTSQNCDARDLVLLVIDEAHKGTGDYAYAQVIRFLMAMNPYFRVLALTATPGSNPDAVQAIIDALHISRIEIRDENSLDLKPFIHHKKVEQHIIKMSDDIVKVTDLLAKLMDSVVKPLRERGVLYRPINVLNLHPYAAHACMKKLQNDQKWAYAPLAKLASLARAMGYLIEGTMGMCYTYLQEISREKDEDDADNRGKKIAAAKSKKLRSDPMFQAVMREIESQRGRGFTMHPKMDRLKALIIQHFAENLGVEEGQTAEAATRVMVFVAYRECVDEVVETLNLERPLIRATKFIGQGTDKQGKKGLAQKEQLEIIKKFQKGEFNVLVSTSIGEEGLDIGEVDLIVCYDAQKTPIRMLQRVGRTGRKRAGCVHVLLSEGREEDNFDTAKGTYKEVQRSILRGEQFELYTDVARLLPDHIKPQCLEKQMEIQEYIREGGRKNKPVADGVGFPEKGVKRKRNDDVGRNIPVGATRGFVSVADLLVKKSKKRKEPTANDFELAGQDDDTDVEIESGILAARTRRTASTPAATSLASPKAMKKLRKAATVDGKMKKKKKRRAPPLAPTSSQFSQKGVDDSDDVAIEQGLILSRPQSSSQELPPSQRCDSPTYLSPRIPTAKTINLADSDSDHLSPPERQCPMGLPCRDESENMAWLVDDDEDANIVIRSSPSLVCFPVTEEQADKVKVTPMAQSLVKTQKYSTTSLTPSPGTSPIWHLSSSPSPEQQNSIRKPSMLPPDLPAHLGSPSSVTAYHYPEPSFPVQPLRVGRRSKHLAGGTAELGSPTLDMPPPSQRRLRRQRDSSPNLQLNPIKKNKTAIISRSLNPLLDLTAVHSGDEVSEGSSHSGDDLESESDQQFLQECPETQVSPSYNQTLAYRQSLFTQAPAKANVPVFTRRPARRGAFGAGLSRSPRRRPLVSSSPPERGDDDDYHFGSFVVDDDAEISYIGNSSDE